MFNEIFSDGSMHITGYVCILKDIHKRRPVLLSHTVIITDKDRALSLKQDYGYEIYSIKLLKEYEENGDK